MESTLGKSLINVLNTEFVKNWAPTNIVKYLTVLVANNLYGLNYTSFDQQDSEGIYFVAPRNASQRYKHNGFIN